MNLNAVEMFVAVVRSGSLSAAAQKLNLPLATVSRNVRQLEAELNVQLLERSPRGTRLTDAGALLYEHASRGIDTLQEAALAVTSHQAVLKGRIRMSIPPSVEPWWALLADFQREHPDIQVAVYTTARKVDLSLEGVDVALRVGTVVHDSLVAKHLLTYRHVLVASPALITRLGAPRHPEDLLALPCATWARDPNVQRPWQLGDRQIEPHAVLSVNDYLHLRDRVLVGDVVTELPPFLAAEGLRDGRLVRLLPDYPLPEIPWSIVYPRHRQPSRVLGAFIAFCQANAAAALGLGT